MLKMLVPGDKGKAVLDAYGPDDALFGGKQTGCLPQKLQNSAMEEMMKNPNPH
jgi:hypothetical protein